MENTIKIIDGNIVVEFINDAGKLEKHIVTGKELVEAIKKSK